MKPHWVKAFDWVMREGILNPIQTSVYLNLVSHQGQNNSAWPAQKRIAEEVKSSVSSVRRAIEALRELGLVDVEARFGPDGSQTSNRYIVLTPDRCSMGAGGRLIMSNKGDSKQEDSHKSSSKMSKRDWSKTSETKPPTAKQIKALIDYMCEADGCTPEEASEEVFKLQIKTQRDAHMHISSYYKETQRQEWRE